MSVADDSRLVVKIGGIDFRAIGAVTAIDTEPVGIGQLGTATISLQGPAGLGGAEAGSEILPLQKVEIYSLDATGDYIAERHFGGFVPVDDEDRLGPGGAAADIKVWALQCQDFNILLDRMVLPLDGGGQTILADTFDAQLAAIVDLFQSPPGATPLGGYPFGIAIENPFSPGPDMPDTADLSGLSLREALTQLCKAAHEEDDTIDPQFFMGWDAATMLGALAIDGFGPPHLQLYDGAVANMGTPANYYSMQHPGGLVDNGSGATYKEMKLKPLHRQRDATLLATWGQATREGNIYTAATDADAIAAAPNPYVADGTWRVKSFEVDLTGVTVSGGVDNDALSQQIVDANIAARAYARRSFDFMSDVGTAPGRIVGIEDTASNLDPDPTLSPSARAWYPVIAASKSWRPGEPVLTTMRLGDRALLLGETANDVVPYPPKAAPLPEPDGPLGPGDLPAHATTHEDGGADEIALGALGGTLTDTQHGSRSGGSLHATAVAAGAAGFLSGVDKTKLDQLSIAGGKTATFSNTLTLAGVDGKTLTVNKTLTFGAGADGYTLTVPGTGTALLGNFNNATKLGIGASPSWSVHVADAQTDAATASYSALFNSAYAQTVDAGSTTLRSVGIVSTSSTGTNTLNILEGLFIQMGYAGTKTGSTQMTTLRGINIQMNTSGSTGNLTNNVALMTNSTHNGTGTGGTLNAVNASVTVNAGAGTATELRCFTGISRNSAANTLPTSVVYYGQNQTVNTASCAITNARVFYAAAPSYGAASAITNSYGLYIENQGASVVSTNAVGLWIASQSGAVGGNYAIFTNTGTVHIGDTLEITDAKNITFGTTTGTKLGTSSSMKIGIWGATPVARPAAWTQNYTTATRTVAAQTAGAQTTPFTGAADGEAKLLDLNALRTDYEKLRQDHLNLLQVVTQIIDDDQLLGLRG